MGLKAFGMVTPSPGQMINMTPEQIHAFCWEREIDERTHDGRGAVLAFPPGVRGPRAAPGVRAHPYAPIRTPARKLTATPQGFYMQKEGMTPSHTDDAQPKGNLPC